MASKRNLQDMAADATAGLFQGMSTPPGEIEESIAKLDPEQDLGKPAEKKMYSFRAPKAHLEEWDAYIYAKGGKSEELCDKALTEYMKKHPLKIDEQEVFELKMKLHALRH